MCEYPSIIEKRYEVLSIVEGAFMADYRKMYSILCGAIDDVIGELSTISSAHHASEHLLNALEQTEEIYIETSSDMDD